MYSFFAYMSRLKHISRWALMRNSVTENVQEHSHMTAVLAHALGVIRRDVFFQDCDPDKCATAALFHDATEIFTGDMPTPVKYFDPDIRAAYKRVEDVATEKLLDTLPTELAPAYAPVLHEEDPEIRRIVKAADKLSAYIKCREEQAAGNGEFSDAAETTLASIRAMEIPEVEWFLDRFDESFGLNLDSLEKHG